MPEAGQPISFMIAQSLARRAVSNWRFVSLWILMRCIPKRPFFKLVPAVNRISAAFTFAIACSFFSSLAIFACGLGWTISSVLLIVAIVYRNQISSLGFTRTWFGLAVLVMIPNEFCSWKIQIGFCVFNCLIAMMGTWENRLSKNQFCFKPINLNSINEGSATILKDEVQVVHAFVDSSGHASWKPKERIAVRKQAAAALNWLSEQAKRYEVDLHFVEHSIREQPSWEKAFPKSKAGYAAHCEFGDWIYKPMKRFLDDQAISSQSNICFLVHVKDKDRNYAVRQVKFQNPTCRFEFAAIASPHSTPVIAHELLHLFGADDYYLSAYFERDCEEPLIRKQLLNNCIMFNLADDIADLHVDELTAQNIGWF